MSRSFAIILSHRAWVPAKYLRGDYAPLMLTFSFRYRHASPRWKEIYEAAPGRVTHHLELWALEEIDGEVRACFQDARLAA